VQGRISNPRKRGNEEVLPVVFGQNALAGEWRAQARRFREQGIALHRDVAFALAVANLLELPDDLPLMPAVRAAMHIPTRLSDPVSLARLKEVARSAGRRERGAATLSF
jgi:hypothetical protein